MRAGQKGLADSLPGGDEDARGAERLARGGRGGGDLDALRVSPGDVHGGGRQGDPRVPAGQVVGVDRVVGTQEGRAHHDLALRPVAHNARHAVHVSACSDLHDSLLSVLSSIIDKRIYILGHPEFCVMISLKGRFYVLRLECQ